MELAIGSTLAGRYEILAVVGRGSFSKALPFHSTHHNTRPPPTRTSPGAHPPTTPARTPAPPPSGTACAAQVCRCRDLVTDCQVAVKVLRNDKDTFDQGLGEIRILTDIAWRDPLGVVPILRLLDYFYFREHLIIVTELLHESLWTFYREARGSTVADRSAEAGSSTLPPLNGTSNFAPAVMKAIAAQARALHA